MTKELPKNWDETDLKSIIAFVIGGDWGKDPNKVNDDKEFIEVACIRGSEIKNWKNNKGATASLRKIKRNSLEKRELQEGDILLEISGGGPDQPVGRILHIDNESLSINEFAKVCTNFLRLVRISDSLNKKFISQYLHYFYLSGKVIKYQGGSNNLRNLKFKDYQTINIPLPPLAEQDRIVAKLDSLFARLDKIKASLARIPELLQNFRQQVLTHAVTGKLTEEWRVGRDLEKWREIQLGELLIDTPKNGAYYPKSKYGEGVRIIRIDAFYEGKLKFWEKVQKVQIPKKDRKTYALQEGNILINRVNSIDYLGKCMLVENLLEPAIFESNMMRLTINETEAYPSYLRYFLTSLNGKRELRKNAKHAVNQASINQTDVKLVLVNIPVLEEQKEIVNRVESLFTKADNIQKKYELLKAKIEQLPQAILHKAFKGELVQQLESDGDARDLLREIEELKKETNSKTNNRKRKIEV